MPRKNRFQRLLAPLSLRNSDICIENRFLVLRPVRHAFCALVFDIVGIAGVFRPRWFVFPIFALPPVLQLMNIDGVGTKYSDEPARGMPEDLLSEQLCADIEASVLPFFRSVTTFDKLYAYAMHGDLQIWQRAALHFRLELAMGNFDAARMLMRWHSKRWFSDETPAEHANERQLCALLDANDHTGIGHCLREIEAAVVAAYKVERLWEPSPFPFEPEYKDWARKSGIKVE